MEDSSKGRQNFRISRHSAQRSSRSGTKREPMIVRTMVRSFCKRPSNYSDRQECTLLELDTVVSLPRLDSPSGPARKGHSLGTRPSFKK